MKQAPLNKNNSEKRDTSNENQREQSQIGESVSLPPPPLQFTSLPLQQKIKEEGEEKISQKKEDKLLQFANEDDNRLENPPDNNTNKENTPFSASRPYQLKTSSVTENRDTEDNKSYTLRKASNNERLPEDVQMKMENSFQNDFSKINIHKNSEQANEMGAYAFTQKNNIHFAPGQYQPYSPKGQTLIGHELTHVIQQQEGNVKPTTQAKGILINDDKHLEKEADEMGAKAARGEIQQKKSSSKFKSLNGTSNVQRKKKERKTDSIIQKFDPTTEQTQEISAPSTVPEGGTNVNQVGIVNWYQSPQLKLRATPSTDEENIIGYLEFNTRAQVLKEFPGGWYFVSLENGQMGYTAKSYISTNLPEPNANLHLVESGANGTAIAIAEQYFADNTILGMDLRFFVNAIAYINNVEVPQTRNGWRQVHFQADDLIWIPSLAYARGLSNLIESGSLTYDMLSSVGLGDIAQSASQKINDFGRAIRLAGQYIPEALGRHALRGLENALVSVALLVLGAAVLLGITTGIGALIGNAPGAAIGFKVGMFLIKWLGLALLVHWVIDSIRRVGSAFFTFIQTIWNADGDPEVIDRGARELAEALGTLVEVIIEGLVMILAARGVVWVTGRVAGSRFGERIGMPRLIEWMRSQGGRETRPPTESNGRPIEPPRPNPSPRAPEGMSQSLIQIRARLRDPKAIEQFDNMYNRMNQNSSRMERAIENMTRDGRSLEQRLIQEWNRANPTPRGDALGEVSRLKTEADTLRTEIETFRTENPEISGTNSWMRAIEGELTVIERMRTGRSEATLERVQGVENNINGLRGELIIARSSRGVTGVGQRFSLDGVRNKVEIDVVRNDGRTWVESKTTQPFSTESPSWTGGRSGEGMQLQAIEMVRSASQNPINGVAPRVVWEFHNGLTRSVANALRSIGVEPRGRIVD